MAAPVKESEYRLSTELTGHSGDVRAVVDLQTDGGQSVYVVTTSRDKTARVWLREDQREYKTVRILQQHKGFVTCTCVVHDETESGREKCFVVTGSQDNTIIVHSMDEDSGGGGEHCLSGHKGTVSCVTYQCNHLISGSWDGTVKVWNMSNFSLSGSMLAHQPAVWGVSGLYEHDGTHRALSGGADRIVRLWELDNSLCVQEYRGHGDVVRDVKVINADVFLSASNDCTIRKWNIHSAQCLMEFYGHEAFVYCIAPTPGLEDDFASCGEDGTVRVWKGGACVQVIKLPCISVWCVCRMEGGDLVTGSSDGVARVFTTESSRMASPEQVAAFQSKVDEHRSAGGEQSIDVSTLPGMDALNQPGKKTGDTKLINNNGKAEVYQWDEASVQWVKIGDAVGQAPKGGSVYMGQEYDYVFDIELDEGNPSMRTLKLPYNKSVDPYIAAEEFLTANNLPAWYLDEVAEFIIKNANVDTSAFTGAGVADPFTGGARYVPGQGGGGGGGEGRDPFTGKGRYIPGSATGDKPAPVSDPQPTVSFTRGGRTVDTNTSSKSAQSPYFPLESVKTFTSPAEYGTKVIAKIREFNDTLHTLSSDQLQLLEAFSTSLASSVDQTPLDLLLSLLSAWPQENVFPVLDLVRLAVLNKYCCDYFTGADRGDTLFQQLLKLANGGAKNHLLVFRILANIFSHDSGAQLMHLQRSQLFPMLSVFMNTDNRTNQIALATVILNYSHYYSLHTLQDGGVSDCVAVIVQVLESEEQDNEAKFRAMVALGTMCVRCLSAVKSSAVSVDYSSLLAPLCDIIDPPKISECALYLLELLL